MVDSLREWFDLACEHHCNRHNNLYTPQLTCLDRNMGIVSSVVHHEGENSAQILIDLAIADVQASCSPFTWMAATPKPDFTRANSIIFLTTTSYQSECGSCCYSSDTFTYCCWDSFWTIQKVCLSSHIFNKLLAMTF